MRIPTPITILGYDGTGACPEISDVWRQVIPEARERFPDVDLIAILDRGSIPPGDPDYPVSRWCVDRVMERTYCWFVVKEHNEAIPSLTRYAQLDRETTTAVDHVAGLYADMHKNTTINWLASHHRLVLATIDARRLLTERAELARQLHDQTGAVAKINRPDGLTRTYYDAHVPADQQLQFPDPEADAGALAEFVELATERFRILRATITGGFPPGFEPAPAAGADDVAAEWAGTNIPVSPALAYADKAMSIPSPRAGEPYAYAREW